MRLKRRLPVMLGGRQVILFLSYYTDNKPNVHVLTAQNAVNSFVGTLPPLKLTFHNECVLKLMRQKVLFTYRLHALFLCGNSSGGSVRVKRDSREMRKNGD